MSENPDDFSESVARPVRHFVDFADPDSAQHIRADVTWLTTHWQCIFGAGCPGIERTTPQAGCCAFGAHFTDRDDEERVAAAVDRLTPQTWQHAADSEELGWAITDEDGDRTTLTLPTGCIFLNSANHPAGPGCALHLLALQEGVPPFRFKPDVCWQLPIRRSYRRVRRPDESEYLELSLDEYDRACWGPGGADLDWYCTASPAALGGDEPLYVSMAGELTELIGEAAYRVLAELCERTVKATGNVEMSDSVADNPATR